MIKIRARIYFKENYDVDAIEEICDKFAEADQWYEERCVRFIGHPERLQELIRAIKTVEEPIKVTEIH